VTRVRIFLDSCVLIEAICSPWSDSRGVLILGRSSVFRFVLSEMVLEETERALTKKLAQEFGGSRRLKEEFRFLLERLDIERVPHVSVEEVQRARMLIRHINDVPILAAAIQAKPDWLLTDNSSHFTREVSRKTGLRIATPQEFLLLCGKLF
jgi:predicted nucleic acid-binding protein